MENEFKSLKSSRKKWSKAEVLGVLRCYAARKEEFSHFRRQKNAFQNVLEDMIFQGLTDSSTTADALKNKMRTLLDAYKAAKDNRKKTGATPIVVPYEAELDEIFGDKPIISNDHTLHLPSQKQTEATNKTLLEDLSREVNNSFSKEDAQTSVEYTDFETLQDEDLPTTSSAALTSSRLGSCPVVRTHKNARQDFEAREDEVVPTTSPTAPASSTLNPVSVVRKRKNDRDIYFEEKLKIRREAMEAEKTQRADFLKSVHESLKEKWQKESEENKIRIGILKSVQKNFEK